jgi:hypothetical protein
MGVTVTAPDGRVWQVARHWPRRLRWRKLDTDLSPADALNFGDVGDLGDGVGGIIGAILVTVALVVFAAALVIIVLPLFLLLGEAVIVVLGVYVVSRRWVVEATTDGPPPDRFAYRVRGWRRSRKAVQEVADALRQGRDPELAAELAPLRL